MLCIAYSSIEQCSFWIVMNLVGLQTSPKDLDILNFTQNIDQQTRLGLGGFECIRLKG